jgi:aconitate hydratase
MVTPGSEQVRATIERDGLLADLEAIGATVLANACGPCIGQWERTDIAKGEKNSILTSYNRNFPKRNDGNPSTLAFIASPEVVVAYALAGRLDSDPIHEGVNFNGGVLTLDAPSAAELPAKGFDRGSDGYVAPVENPAAVKVVVDPKSERIALLAPFEPVDKTAVTRICRCCSGARQMHDRPYFPGGAVAQVPWPPGPHQRQQVYRGG